jgi:hypothetical protein
MSEGTYRSWAVRILEEESNLLSQSGGLATICLEADPNPNQRASMVADLQAAATKARNLADEAAAVRPPEGWQSTYDALVRGLYLGAESKELAAQACAEDDPELFRESGNLKIEQDEAFREGASLVPN